MRTTAPVWGASTIRPFPTYMPTWWMLRPGDAVVVERADGTRLRFLVEQARSYPKAAFPTAAVFGPAPSATLRLVTCTGEFDRARGSYRDNLVVSARLAGVVG